MSFFFLHYVFVAIPATSLQRSIKGYAGHIFRFLRIFCAYKRSKARDCIGYPITVLVVTIRPRRNGNQVYLVGFPDLRRHLQITSNAYIYIIHANR